MDTITLTPPQTESLPSVSGSNSEAAASGLQCTVHRQSVIVMHMSRVLHCKNTMAFNTETKMHQGTVFCMVKMIVNLVFIKALSNATSVEDE